MSDIETGMTTAADGTMVAWTRQGSGPSLVLVHGITDSAQGWFGIPADLAASHTVVTVDLRGHGLSAKAATYDIASLAGDVAAVIVDLGLDAPALIGHSLGGMVVSALAAQMPVRAVVNVDQSLDLAAFSEQTKQVVGLLSEDFSAGLRTVFDPMMPEGLPEAAKAHWDRLLASADPDVVLGIWAPTVDLDPADLAAMIDGAVAGLSAPYLAIHGIDPGSDYPAWLSERIPQAKVELWEGGGHFPHLMEPERFTARVREHLGTSDS